MLSQKPRKRTGATADLECILAIRRNVFEQGIVIVIVRRPAFVVEKCEAIKVCFN
jgi:hypothetical protein